MILWNIGFSALLILASLVVPRTQARQLFLLAASYIFYGAWGWSPLGLLAFSSVLNFLLGSWLQRRPNRLRLWVGVVSNILLLGFFKYASSLARYDAGSQFEHLFQGIVLPIGMSFWTFQALSYLFDVYNEEDLDPTFIEFSLYMVFWPTVLMGPICRLPNLLPQFRAATRVSLPSAGQGLRRIGLGVMMKLVLAQLFAPGVNQGFANASLGGWSGLDVWVLAIGFGFQLFFDFAGYSHIVIGFAQLCGYELQENFNAPFLSSTPAVFWTRWHISLSLWIRDYVFVPLATRRREAWWRYAALAFSMILFGAWHGAKLTFVFWGAYQATLLIAHRLGQQVRRKLTMRETTLGAVLSGTITFLAISLGWILFRANDLAQALSMFRAAMSPFSYLHGDLPLTLYATVISTVVLYFAYNAIIKSGWLATTRWVRMTVSQIREMGIAGEIAEYLWEKRRWWLTPSFVTVGALALATMLVLDTDINPFLYAVF